MSHHPSSHAHPGSTGALRTALVLTFGILVVEIVAGYLADSLALLSDAGHILTDVVALGLAWYAARLSNRPANERNTYGYRRGSILAALANSTLLLVVTLWIIVEAVPRIQHPQHVTGGLVIVAALVAIGVNLFIALQLRHDREGNLNVRAASLHVSGDIAASVGVVISGLAALVAHIYIVDALVSIGIALLIAWGAWQIAQETVLILMEAIPKDLELVTIQAAMREVPGVTDVHDLHVWSLSDGYRLLSAHVSVPDQSLADAANLLADLKLILRSRFQIEHATIELECVDCRVPQRRPVRLHQRGT